MQFTILGFDDNDAAAPGRRKAARPEHIKKGEELIDSGNLLYGAVLLNEDNSMKGSMYVVNFQDESELQDYLVKEPYVINKVWENIQIHKSNTRDPWQYSHDKAWFEKYVG